MNRGGKKKTKKKQTGIHFLLLFSLSLPASIATPIGQALRFHGNTPAGRVLCAGGCAMSGGAYCCICGMCGLMLVCAATCARGGGCTSGERCQGSEAGNAEMLDIRTSGQAAFLRRCLAGIGSRRNTCTYRTRSTES